jgi:cytochrome c biogenesis protein CcdA
MSSELVYFAYLAISVALTVWVARTLQHNGRVFLVESFRNPEMGDSVNRLLVVGFYLVNIGFVSLFLSLGDVPTTSSEAIRFVSTKVGIVLLLLGMLHFASMFNIARLRSRSKHSQHPAPTENSAFLNLIAQSETESNIKPTY